MHPDDEPACRCGVSVWLVYVEPLGHGRVACGISVGQILSGVYIWKYHAQIPVGALVLRTGGEGRGRDERECKH